MKLYKIEFICKNPKHTFSRNQRYYHTKPKYEIHLKRALKEYPIGNKHIEVKGYEANINWKEL